ncbi:MAG: hypothetical protein H6550_04490 [Chitinophagales bacterium]|nr:hypothetical protein [Chitinophagales bacterium]
MKYSLLFTSLILLAACGGRTPTDNTTTNHFYAPIAGTIVAADSTPIEEDGLNDFYYSVIISSTDSSNEGYYALDAAYGPNEAHTLLAYPKLDREITPAIKLDDIPYSYIAGFYFAGSDTFKDYARVSAKRVGPMNTQIEVRYIKTYFMDSTIKK